MPDGGLHVRTHSVTLLDNLLVGSTRGERTKNHQWLTRDVSNHKKALKHQTTTECHYSSNINEYLGYHVSIAIEAHMHAWIVEHMV